MLKTYRMVFLGEITKDVMGRQLTPPFDYEVRLSDDRGNNVIVTESLLKKLLQDIKDERLGKRFTAYKENK